MPLRFSTVILLVLFLSDVLAQESRYSTAELDSILTETTPLARSQPSEAFETASSLVALLRTSHSDSSQLAAALGIMGFSQWNMGNYSQAMDHYWEALSVNIALKDSLGISQSLTDVASVNYRYGNYPEAMAYLLKALRIRERFNDSAAISRSYLALGILKTEVKDYHEALAFYDMGLPIAKALDLHLLEATIYNHIGRAWRKLELYDKAAEAHEKSIVLYRALEDEVGIARYNNNMGSISRRKGKFSQALDYFFEATVVHERIGDKEGLADGFNDIAKTYLQLGKYDQALVYAEKALEIARQAGLRDDVRYAYEVLSGIYGALGQYRKAYEFHMQYGRMKDSLLDAQKEEQLEQLHILYKSEKKEQEIAMLRKDQKIQSEHQRFILSSLLGGVLILLLFAGFTYNRYRMKHRSHLELEKKNQEIDVERQRAEDLLLNILPAETAAELKNTGKASPQKYEQVTVLFTDFKGFSKIAERLSPEELVEELDYCFKAFDRIIGKYVIEKIKTIGDAYMCVSGLPGDNPHHARDMILAGMEIQTFLKELGKQRKQEDKAYFEARIGIHTGPVVAGIVGVKKFAYDIWGDTVNTAARVESAGEVGKVNVSQSTYELIKEEFTCFHRGKVMVKNKGEIDMYFVENKALPESLSPPLP